MSNYTLLCCELYDRLEAIATLKKECHLTYLNENNELAEVRGRIVDVYAADGAEGV